MSLLKSFRRTEFVRSATKEKGKMRPLMPLQMKASKEEGYRSQHILSDLVI